MEKKKAFTCAQQSFEGLLLKYSNYFVRKLLPTSFFLSQVAIRYLLEIYTPICYLYTHTILTITFHVVPYVP